MSKFHINPEGEPGDCSAQAGNCPFGTEDNHYDTIEDARKAYEMENSLRVLISSSKDKINASKLEEKDFNFNEQDSDVESGEYSYDLPNGWKAEVEFGGAGSYFGIKNNKKETVVEFNADENLTSAFRADGLNEKQMKRNFAEVISNEKDTILTGQTSIDLNW